MSSLLPTTCLIAGSIEPRSFRSDADPCESFESLAASASLLQGFRTADYGLGYCVSGVRRLVHAGSLSRGRQGRRLGQADRNAFWVKIVPGPISCLDPPPGSFLPSPPPPTGLRDREFRKSNS